MKKLITFMILTMTTFTLTHAQVADVLADAQNDVKFGDKRVVRTVKKMAKAGALDPEKTCLDDYAKRSKHLAWRVGLTPPIGAGTTAGGVFGAIYAGAAIGASTGTGLGALFAALIFAVLGAVLAAGAGLVALIGLESFAIVRLVKTNFLIKVLANAYDGAGKSLEKFQRKYLRKYRSDKSKATLENLAKVLTKGDMEAAFCDGSLRGRSANAKLKKRLAKKKDIFRYIHKNL